MTAGSTSETTVTITDDDLPSSVTVSFEQANYTVAESADASTNDVMENESSDTVSSSGDPGTRTTVPLTKADQSGASSDQSVLRAENAPQSVNERKVFYKLTFTGNFDADALMPGETVPTGAGFSKLVGAIHNGEATPWGSGSIAGTVLETFVESGASSDGDAYMAELNGTQGVFTGFTISGTGDESGFLADGTGFVSNVTVRGASQYLTVVAKISPSSDWFVGVSKVDLRPGGTWIVDRTIDLYAWDLGTEDGSDFSAGAVDTDPQSAISSLRNSGKFSADAVATLRIELLPPPKDQLCRIGPEDLPCSSVDDPPLNAVDAEAFDGGIRVLWVPLIGIYVDGYKVQWVEDGEALSDFGSDREGRVIGADARAYEITGLTNGTKYWVRVIPFNAAGNGEPSEVDFNESIAHRPYRATPYAGDRHPGSAMSTRVSVRSQTLTSQTRGIEGMSHTSTSSLPAPSRRNWAA